MLVLPGSTNKEGVLLKMDVKKARPYRHKTVVALVCQIMHIFTLYQFSSSSNIFVTMTMVVQWYGT